ncbi:MAG: hypothetical protein J6X97_04875 [Lachnospiraceae bacterium]|nr:hypothetical protein [Lachnospiraceae bacterium]
MKKRAYKTAVLALAFSVLATFGCATVVTDVNAELAAIYPKEDLGIPVKLNENYIEVAYNPSAGVKEDVKEEETDKKREEEPSENTEAVSENDTVETDAVPEETEDTSDTDADADTDTEENDAEDGDADDADSDEDSSENTEEVAEETASEEDNGSDLNASMAEDNFDAEFYAKAYPDVVSVFGDSPEALYKHYLDYGKAEGRSCNEEEFALLNEAVN